MATRRGATLALGLLAVAGGALAIGQDTCVAFQSSSTTFTVVKSGKAAPILLSPDEWPGVQRAAFDFASDIQSVTGVKPTLTNVTSSPSSSNSTSNSTDSTAYGSSGTAIIVGTLGKSSLIDDIVNRTNIDVSSIQGKWEAFLAKEVANPLPGISSAYVVIGADKRGSIYALYDHSEQFGVSPWYWWADVPPKKHNALFVNASGCWHGSPTVKYRGIFLNDEQPALQNWAKLKFTNGTGAALTGSPFNHFFYTKMFELLLRLKANYIWPAMWSSAFCVDDDQNQPLADWYGIVMGTSHEEPLMRSLPPEWDLFGKGPWDYSSNQQNVYDFWKVGAERGRPYEGVYTIGMRGSGDLPLAGGAENIALMEKIVADQRSLFQEVFNTSDMSTIPQVWALYKEVLGYYEDGMTVPDDVMLLWSDDNYGNIRRAPTPNERNRTGGSGIYYHIDYVGPPRNYKWITSSQIEKTYEQMSTAVNRDATKIWVVNVGDLKPYEMHTEFFITYGYDASKWNYNNLNSYVTGWAQREFGFNSDDAATVAAIVHNVTQHNARRKPELWNGTTYSLINYREADAVLAMLRATSDSSNRLYRKVSAEMKPAFFQLVQHPVQATLTLQEMQVAAGLNNLRASQAAVIANHYKSEVERLFRQDYSYEVDYHTLLDGMNHMMDQTHIGYVYWEQPLTNSMPYVTAVQEDKPSLLGPMRLSVEGNQGVWPGDNKYDCSAGYGCPDPTLTIDPYNVFGDRYVDIDVGGPGTFSFAVTSNAPWVKITPTQASLSPSNPEQRVLLSVDWSKVTGVESAHLDFKATIQNDSLYSTRSISVTLVANHTVVPGDFHGFVEGDGAVSIEAAHAARNTSVQGLTWIELPGLGKTLSGVTPWPRGGEELNFTAGAGPSIEYDFYTFNTKSQKGHVTITAKMSPSLNSLGDDRPLGIALQVDSGAAQTKYFVPPATPGTLPAAWDGLDGWVAASINDVSFDFVVPPGAHTLKVWMIEPTVILQKIVIDTGGVKSSYLGPPESIRV
ncbi:hypothetical protein GSI_13481 [Ganoderma sinense ZZ0214-1]|uniref:Gylcosyl hydrolase 115 C-terminal domain-containing protein n=1 Tax=Ganoderma sinense ZZ0214-1 TaxID=1077348 RepID=A0A2G8RQG3_9APHY|nr:hypothetical protein GSI_13481 [Ganoderma sinense ZZ0214-1]